MNNKIFQLQEKAKDLGAQLANDPMDIDIAIELQEVKDRLNYAWQDEEAQA